MQAHCFDFFGEGEWFSFWDEVGCLSGPESFTAFEEGGGELGGESSLYFDGVNFSVGVFEDEIDLGSGLGSVVANSDV